MAADSPVRSLVLWFPDWSVTALIRDGGGLPGGTPLEPGIPVAVMEHNVVAVCSAAARAEGVRRGQRRRDAQARCPGLRVVAADAARDHRAFAPVVTQIEAQAPGVQVMRPGLCALRARGPARYYGGEVEAARVLLDALHEFGVDGVRAGIADGPFTAEQAAKGGTTETEPVFAVPAGGAAGFLAPLPVAVLDAAGLGGAGLGGVVSRAGGARAGGARAGGARAGGAGSRASAQGAGDLVGLLGRLGVRTLGEFAAMPQDLVRDRFGEGGVRLHALAAGHDSRPVTPRTPPPELHREVAFEPPLELADQVAFGVRVAADEFVARLGAIDLVCTELRVELAGDRGESSDRVWLHPASFDAAAVVDRVRWQLAEAGGVLGGWGALVRISPEAVEEASHHAPAIFGSGPDERVHHVLSRVQAMLGHRGVLTPAIGGGRWLAERQVLVPWGDRAITARERARPWPGSLPDPLPATVFPEPRPVEVTGADEASVAVGERGAVTAAPVVLREGGRRREVVAWAGPWPVVERGWDAARRRRAYRFQLVDADQVAWLLVWEEGAWQAEGRYD